MFEKKKKFIHSFSWIFNWKTTPSSFVPFYLLMPVQLIPRRKSSVSAHIPSSIKDPPVLSSPKAEDTHTHTHTPHSGNFSVHTHTALGKLSSSHTHFTWETLQFTNTSLGKLSSSHTHHTWETLQFTHTPHSGNSPALKALLCKDDECLQKPHLIFLSSLLPGQA